MVSCSSFLFSVPFFDYLFRQQLSYVQKITILGTGTRITHQLRNEASYVDDAGILLLNVGMMRKILP
jgi:hypothetical protein